MRKTDETQTADAGRRTKMLAIMVTPEEHDRYRDMAWGKRTTLSQIVRNHLENLARRAEAKS